MSVDENRLSHSVWECKYHIVWIPKYRRKRMYPKFKRQFLTTTPRCDHERPIRLEKTGLSIHKRVIEA
jgi:REP element-mobilizing transposase RayT